jgi:hypothetical protein
MDRAELKRAAAREGLTGALFLDEGPTAEHAVVLEPRQQGWAVYVTDERASVLEKTLRVFADESGALEYMLHKLRQRARADQAMDKLRRRGPADETA